MINHSGTQSEGVTVHTIDHVASKGPYWLKASGNNISKRNTGVRCLRTDTGRVPGVRERRLLGSLQPRDGFRFKLQTKGVPFRLRRFSYRTLQSVASPVGRRKIFAKVDQVGLF